MDTMQELMLHFLQDIYYAEKLGLRSMAKMIKAAENPELKAALESHRRESEGQIERLGEVFAALGKKPRGKVCAAMDGIAEEGNEAISEGQKGPIRDAALIACEQAAEHYEIARYGAMVAWARSLGLDAAVEILEGILQEEKDADLKLSEIADRALNPAAVEEDGEEDGEEEEAAPEPVKKSAVRKSPRARTPARAGR